MSKDVDEALVRALVVAIMAELKTATSVEPRTIMPKVAGTKWMKVQDAAHYAGNLSPKTLYAAVRNGHLKATSDRCRSEPVVLRGMA